jgi:hypothetical protein
VEETELLGDRVRQAVAEREGLGEGGGARVMVQDAEGERLPVAECVVVAHSEKLMDEQEEAEAEGRPLLLSVTEREVEGLTEGVVLSLAEPEELAVTDTVADSRAEDEEL